MEWPRWGAGAAGLVGRRRRKRSCAKVGGSLPHGPFVFQVLPWNADSVLFRLYDRKRCTNTTKKHFFFPIQIRMNIVLKFLFHH